MKHFVCSKLRCKSCETYIVVAAQVLVGGDTVAVRRELEWGSTGASGVLSRSEDWPGHGSSQEERESDEELHDGDIGTEVTLG